MSEAYYGAANDYRGYLMHYGVKGMHWGVRRYQNPDGSLTDAGRKHYGYSGDRRVGSILKDTINDAKDVVSAAKNRLSSKIDIPSKRTMPWFTSYDKVNKDAKRSSDLGLRALSNIRYEKYDPKNVSDINWFMFEDQTIGYYEVANAISKGVSKNKLKEVLYKSASDEETKFDIDEFYAYDGNDEFVNACYDIANKELRRKVIRTAITSS